MVFNSYIFFFKAYVGAAYDLKMCIVYGLAVPSL